jgi:hypothetical protein
MRAKALYAALLAMLGAAAPAAAQISPWTTVVNNADTIPGAPGSNFNSYNQPSINAGGMVVFRARSSAQGGSEPISGTFQRDTSGPNPILTFLKRGDAVPQPNNTLYNGVPAAFSEFPSTPRIDHVFNLIATRGQSQPVWTYILGDTETRVGTSGIYANPGGVPTTAASLLGAAVNADQVTITFPQYSVPDAPAGTRFDQFPGSAAVTGNRYIVWKGNYTDPSDQLSKTGVYFRDLAINPPSPTVLIARSGQRIPNQPPGGTAVFGSTAPPSAANGFAFFTGFDVEEAPTLGGVYRAPLSDKPPLQTLVGVGDPVPGEPGETFTTFGEGLSVSSDGRYVSFWGAWGTQTFSKTLLCPTDGNAAIIAYCNEIHPTGLVVQIPVNQGIFVHDANLGITYRIARTLEDGVDDFLFWVFSGAPPGVGGGDDGQEPARWRGSAFSALSAGSGRPVQTVYKAQKANTQGLYLREGSRQVLPAVTLAETGITTGQAIDPIAPADSIVIALGVERDGFRGDRLAITASMLYTDPVDPKLTVGWAGIYQTRVAIDAIFSDGFE